MKPILFSHRPYWAKRFGVAKQLPMSRAEMEALGWDSCDVILVTGDAYVDHPSFGMALIGRLLEAQGFRVGIISQPKWNNADNFKVLGKPNLFFGVTAGNIDSMVNHYTATQRIRSDDAFTPGGRSKKRPDRASIVYAQRCREAYSDTPIVLGGMEASLRRAAHYDFWSDKVRRSILVDAKANLLLYGNAERAIVEVAHRLGKGESIDTIHDLRGSVFVTKEENKQAIRLPSYEEVKDKKTLYAKANRELHLETNPSNAKTLVQAHGDRDVQMNPPPIPLTTKELDTIYELPFSRMPHESYGSQNIPAYEMIRFSVNIMRGCFGGCSFCSLALHEGRIIQSRSEESVLREIEAVRDKTPGFTGVISDLGGPTANLYQMHCNDCKAQESCRKLSCLSPSICKNLKIDHEPIIHLYRQARKIPGIKKIVISSGVRFDVAVQSKTYIKELATHHVGGYLKIAPEHVCEEPLSKMMKPGIDRYDRFSTLFLQFSKEAGKEQYLIPYFIGAHPGTTNEDMLELALWLKKNNFKLNQVQIFLPTPMTLATTMYHTGKNPLKPVNAKSENVFVPKKGRTRRLHKAFLRYHDPKNAPLLREELKEMGREDLIGPSKQHLVHNGHQKRFNDRRDKRKK